MRMDRPSGAQSPPPIGEVAQGPHVGAIGVGKIEGRRRSGLAVPRERDGTAVRCEPDRDVMPERGRGHLARVAAVGASQAVEPGLARVGFVPALGDDALAVGRPHTAPDANRAVRDRKGVEPGAVAVHDGFGRRDPLAVGRPVRALVRLGAELEQVCPIWVDGVEDGVFLHGIVPTEDDPPVGRRPERPSTGGEQRCQDQGQEDAGDGEHPPGRARRQAREPKGLGSHRDTPQGGPPGRPLGTVLDEFEDRVELAVDDGPVGKVIQRRAEGQLEITRRAHARCSALYRGRRASASSEARNAVSERFSRDFRVPTGTPRSRPHRQATGRGSR